MPQQQTKTTTAKAGEQRIDLYRPVDSPKTVAALLEKQLPKVAALLPGAIDPERFLRLAIAMLNRNWSKLGKCTARSLLGSIADASALGLDLDERLGHAYLVPYGQLAQLIIGYKGFIHMMIATGRVRGKPYARAVYEGDKFEMIQGTEERITHVPCAPADRVKKNGQDVLMGCYSVIPFVDGSIAIEWMWDEELEAIRKRSKASGDGPWMTDTIEMKKKTVLRRQSKTADIHPVVTKVASSEEKRDLGVGLDTALDLAELSTIELVAGRTADRTEELAKKYTEQKGGDPGPVTEGAGPTAAPFTAPAKPRCDAEHHDPTVHCELEKGHRSKVHQWVKPDDRSVPGVDDVPLPDEPGANR